MTEHNIRISVTKPFFVWLRLLIGLTCVVLAPIAIGVIVGSAAMQWVGFVFGLLLTVAFLYRNKEPALKSTAEARAYLDRIDAGEV